MEHGEYTRRVLALESDVNDSDKVRIPGYVIAAVINACRQLDLAKRRLFYKVKPTDERVLEYDLFVEGTEDMAYDIQERGMKFSDIGHLVPLRLIHALLGMATEVGELWEAVFEAIACNKPIDLDNLREEFGDSQWYHALAMDECEKMVGFSGTFSLDCITDANIAKLEARRAHAGGVSAHGGDRDLAAEAKAAKEAQDGRHS